MHRSEVRVTRLGHRSPFAAAEISIVVESFPRDDGAVAAGGHQDLPPRVAAAAAARRQRGDRGVVGVRAAAREVEGPRLEVSWQGPRLDDPRVAAGDDGAVGEDGDGVEPRAGGREGVARVCGNDGGRKRDDRVSGFGSRG